MEQKAGSDDTEGGLQRAAGEAAGDRGGGRGGMGRVDSVGVRGGVSLEITYPCNIIENTEDKYQVKAHHHECSIFSGC